MLPRAAILADRSEQFAVVVEVAVDGGERRRPRGVVVQVLGTRRRGPN